ncbi:MAG: hypothetical protein KC503_17560 [Myxococcales bacterium]|nr:hypothetical protein [Myxococcales bacterium]
MARHTPLVIAFALLWCPACKKEQPKKQEQPAQAPSIAPQAPTKAKPVVTPRPKKGADDDWRNTRLDARPASRSKKTEPAAKQASAQDAGGPSDADVLARKAAEARVADEKALDSKLNGISGKLGACLRKSGAREKNTDVRIRIHRSGYIMSATASGVSTAVQTCISTALANVRLGGLKSPEGLTVKRTFKLFDKSKAKNNTSKTP